MLQIMKNEALTWKSHQEDLKSLYNDLENLEGLQN